MRRKLLIIEDDVDISDTLKEILEAKGYEVEAAVNGRAALKALARGRLPSLILLDLMMPVMNGWAFREQQRCRADLAHIPILVLTADTRALQRKPALDAAGYLFKPVDLGALLRTVDRLSGAADRTRDDQKHGHP